MEIKNNQLMLIATICTFVLLVLLMFFPIPDANAQIFMAVSGIALGFFFGSSATKNRQSEPPKGDSNDTITAEKITIASAPASLSDV